MGERGQIEAESLVHPRVLGVLDGNDMADAHLESWVRSAHEIYAADGGANRLLQFQVRSDMTVGDLDSIAMDARFHTKQLVFDPDQDYSDCDKLIRMVEAKGHHRLTLCNLEGDLPDHFLGTIQSAVRSDLQIRLALRRGIGHIVKRTDERVFAAPIGARISLIPIERCFNVHLEGVAWELSGASLEPSGLTSLSNRATAERVVLRMGGGAAVLFILHPEMEQPLW